MQKQKTILLILAAAVAMTMLTLPASAASAMPSINGQMLASRIISPRWASTTLVVPSITNSGRNISVSLLITPKKSAEKSSGTLYLEQYVGGSWKTVTSWVISKSGTVDMTKSCTGKSKEKYRTKVDVTTGSDRITATSTEITL